MVDEPCYFDFDASLFSAESRRRRFSTCSTSTLAQCELYHRDHRSRCLYSAAGETLLDERKKPAKAEGNLIEMSERPLIATNWLGGGGYGLAETGFGNIRGLVRTWRSSLSRWRGVALRPRPAERPRRLALAAFLETGASIAFWLMLSVLLRSASYST